MDRDAALRRLGQAPPRGRFFRSSSKGDSPLLLGTNRDMEEVRSLIRSSSACQGNAEDTPGVACSNLLYCAHCMGCHVLDESCTQLLLLCTWAAALLWNIGWRV